MFSRRVFEYAVAQARVRARIGAMPAPQTWQYIAEARDLDNTIQRMRENGLAHWLADLPRTPDQQTIESSLLRGIASLTNGLCQLLPSRWREVKRWLRAGLSVATVEALLRNEECVIPAGSDPLLHSVAQEPLERRAQVLHASPYREYMDEQHAARMLDRWVQAFDTVCPALSGREAYIVRRLRQLLQREADAVLEQRRHWRDAEQPEKLNIDTQWRLREQLAMQLRALLGGEPFHGGLVLIYALLELLQYERCRALLLASARDWQAVGVV